MVPQPVIDIMKTTPLIHEVALLEEIERHGEGLDPQALMEAVAVEEFFDPMEGPDLLLQLAKEGLI